MRFSIKAKLLLSACFLALVVTFFIWVDYSGKKDSAEILSELGNSNQQWQLIRSAQLEIANTWQFLTDASLTQDSRVIRGEARNSLQEVKSYLNELGEIDPELAPQIASLNQSVDAFMNTGKEMFSAYGVSRDEGNRIMEEFDTDGENMLDRLEILSTPILEELTSLEQAYTQQNQKSQRIFIIVGSLTILFVFFFGYLLSNQIVKPIKESSRSMEALVMKQGNLTEHLEVLRKDELGDMKDWFNQFVDKVQNVLVNLSDLIHKNAQLGGHLGSASRETAESVAGIIRRIHGMEEGGLLLDKSIQQASSSMEEILSSIESLNHQVEQQFQAIDQSSSSTEQIMASVTNVANISESRLSSMETLVQLIKNGGEKVEDTSIIIQEIQKNADDMMDMIDIINNISSQTNLLAMNASIEAAHAGDAGRGFAVVADEIRKLAEDTGENANRIAQSLHSTTEKINEATSAGQESEKALNVINREVSLFSGALKEVSSSMVELSQASNEILNSISTLKNTSDVVVKASEEMRLGAKDSMDSILQIKDVSAQNLTNMNRVMERTEELNRVSLQVSAFSNQNKYNNTLLINEMERFHLGSERKEEQDISIGIDWSDLLSVGIDAMDEEHKELFKRINALLSALLGKSKDYDIGELVGFINEYIDYHFRDEEKMLDSVNYPELSQHKKLHAIYEEYFDNIEKELKAGRFDSTLLIEIQEKVVNWLLDHIAKVDKKYGVYIANLNQA